VTFALFVLLWNLALLWAFEVVNWITSIQEWRSGYWPFAPKGFIAPGIRIRHFPKKSSVWVDLGNSGGRGRGIRVMFAKESVLVLKLNGDKGASRWLRLGSRGVRENIWIGKLGIEMLQHRRRGDDILTVHWGWRKVREWVLRPKRYITGATR
jgi:hypothetical protein